MIIRDLLEMLTRHASEFRKDLDHYSRNSHMHAIREAPTQDQIDAVLTGFINRLAGSMGVDYGLYASDLAKSNSDKVA